MQETLFILCAVIIIALAFDYVNGFHDAANAIATSVSTRSLSPGKAVTIAAVFNFIGAFLFTGVAKTITSGIVVGDATNRQSLILAALMGAIIWNIITWYFGLPSSSSHALVGGLVGVGIAHVGSQGVIWSGVVNKVIAPGLISPIIGIFFGYLFMLAIYWLLRNASSSIENKFKYAQWFSCMLMAFSQGSNDAQKVMGIITLALFSASTAGIISSDIQPTTDVLWQTKFACATTIALGTSAGGWRIIKTIGSKIVRLKPINGFVADATSASIILSAAALGMPISTTHVVTSSIMGVGAVKRFNAVRWSVAGNIVGAWVMTLPASAFIAWCSYYVIKLIDPGL
ncbi:inorganic phosphate transporter [bacterium]|nr:inorganic phosphate transporter [bacterium]